MEKGGQHPPEWQMFNSLLMVILLCRYGGGQHSPDYPCVNAKVIGIAYEPKPLFFLILCRDHHRDHHFFRKEYFIHIFYQLLLSLFLSRPAINEAPKRFIPKSLRDWTIIVSKSDFVCHFVYHHKKSLSQISL